MLSTNISGPATANIDMANSQQFEAQISIDKDNNNQSVDANEIEPEKSIIERDDPLACIKNVIKWKGEIGYLPGSVCRFKLDHYGDLLLADDFDEEPARKKQKFITDNVSNEAFLGEDLSRCKNCNNFGFKEDFFKNGRYCKDCANMNPIYFKMFKNLSMLYDTNNLNATNSTTSAELSKPMPSNSDSEKYFSWETYLSKNNFIAIPSKSFMPCQSVPPTPNQFEVNMKLEGIDPYHPSRFCVLTVAEILGVRLRLSFDGYKEKYNFWINAHSEFIFPVGFCKSTGRELEPPHGIPKEEFNWEEYLSDMYCKAAPSEFFTIAKEDPEKVKSVIAMGFNINKKLEAVDKANAALICVASIRDILNDYLLIHFDGWDDSYDYWAHYTSSLIHPIHWCKSKGKALTAPKDYRSDSFNWDEYLSETDTEAVPPKAFKIKAASTWKTGMKLEVVDLRNPVLVRVASMVGRLGHTIKIHFDGWEDKYDYWIDDDCPNLHPTNWCSQTNHPLQPPPNNEPKSFKSCPTNNCNGLGHRKWYRYDRHTKQENCPYYESNIDYEPPDRYEYSDEDFVSSSELDEDEDDEEELISEQSEITNVKSSSEEEDVKNEFCNTFSSCTYNVIRRENQVVASNSSPDLLQNCKQLLNKEALSDPNEVMAWDYCQVEQFIQKLTDCSITARIFSDQRIDGESFLMLKQEDLTDRLNIKLGPAVKIYSTIVSVRFLFDN